MTRAWRPAGRGRGFHTPHRDRTDARIRNAGLASARRRAYGDGVNDIEPTLVTAIAAAIGAVILLSVLPTMIRGYISERRARIDQEQNDRPVNLLIAAIFGDH